MSQLPQLAPPPVRPDDHDHWKGFLIGGWSGSDEGHEEFEGPGQGEGGPGADQCALGRPALRALADRCAGLLQAATGETDAALDTLAGATGSHGAEP